MVFRCFQVHSQNPHSTCSDRFIRRAAQWQNTLLAETTFETKHICQEVPVGVHTRGSHNVTVTIALLFGLSVKTVVGCPSLWAVWAVSAVRVLGRPAARIKPLGAGPPAKRPSQQRVQPKTHVSPSACEAAGPRGAAGAPLGWQGGSQSSRRSCRDWPPGAGAPHTGPQAATARPEGEWQRPRPGIWLPRFATRREAHKAKKKGRGGRPGLKCLAVSPAAVRSSRPSGVSIAWSARGHNSDTLPINSRPGIWWEAPFLA
jgi:hypothetical protein